MKTKNKITGAVSGEIVKTRTCGLEFSTVVFFKLLPG